MIKISEVKVKCGKCGAKVSPGYDFCLSCGTEFSEVTPSTKVRSSTIGKDDYIFRKKYKCRDCRKRFISKNKIRLCPECSSGNIKKAGSGDFLCECVFALIVLAIILFLALLRSM